MLDQILSMTLDLLEHPEFKNFGDLQKSRYQNSKSEDEMFLKSDLLKNTVVAPENRRHKPLTKRAIKKGSISRKKWYANPENYKKFLESIKTRDKKKANQSPK